MIRPRLVAASEVLEVGGSRVAVQRFSTEAVIGGARYTVIDRRRLDFHARLEPPHRFIPMDVTNADFADESFDVILCNHTLPYIRDDGKALSEIFRCLKADGLAMLDSSHDEDKTRSVHEYRRRHPQLGDEYFAENGDQWVYGQDYVTRLEAAGFTTRIDVLFADRDAAFKREHGLKEHHELIVAFKSPRGEARFSFPPGQAGRTGND
jgi:SAM-dependent methyltransferase